MSYTLFQDAGQTATIGRVFHPIQYPYLGQVRVRGAHSCDGCDSGERLRAEFFGALRTRIDSAVAGCPNAMFF
ncbi:hypothetical protein CCHOA_10535 [Corynebacterium choanae]|uniref:Uncharacterized protein n=1 Tax=Corynebacterium choanae TaxID=1862358 RepID=A0A3G6J922_9CORY|nr:hypothetical protein CCHOA_10535 [Corynebacterium choanae]